MHAKVKIHEIEACTFLDVCERNSPVPISSKKDAYRRKLVLFFCLTVYIKYGVLSVLQCQLQDCSCALMD